MFEISTVAFCAGLCAFWAVVKVGGASYGAAARCVSTVHAAVQSVFGVLCVLEGLGYFGEEYTFTMRTMVYGRNPLTSVSGEIFFGYILYDLLHVLCLRELRVFDDILHHLIFLTIAYLGITRSFLQIGFIWLILCEVSTVFLNFRWFLFKAGMESSTLYFYNGLCLVASFFVFRVVLYGAGMLFTLATLLPLVNESEELVLRLSPYALLVAYMLNIHWFVVLVKRARQSYNNTAKAAADKPKTG